MPAPTRRRAPTADEQQLLLKHFRELRLDFIRDLMRDNSITGRSQNEDTLIELVEKELRAGNLSWDKLIAFLDFHEPNGSSASGC